MMRLPRFRHLAPRSADEAVRMMADAGPDVTVDVFAVELPVVGRLAVEVEGLRLGDVEFEERA